jgi:hypothetical protein
MQVADDLTAQVRVLAALFEVRFYDDESYDTAISLAVEALKLGRRMAAADVLAEAEHHGSAAMASVMSAFRVAAHVAEHGRFQRLQGGSEASGGTPATDEARTLASVAAGPPLGAELFVDDTGRMVFVHPEARCAGQPCCIHAPSGHPMASWPQRWDDTRRIVERVCEHNVGHPDPDDLQHRAGLVGHGAPNAYCEQCVTSTGVCADHDRHTGCDGCCGT